LVGLKPANSLKLATGRTIDVIIIADNKKGEFVRPFIGITPGISQNAVG
jgi:hypothetical protein